MTLRGELSMERSHARLLGPVLLVAILGVSGCNHMWTLDRASEVEFMNLWKTYSHCRSSSDLNEMQRDAEQLVRTAKTITPKAPSFPVLPALFIKEPPLRLTVDPQAMGMACTLYAAQTAQSLGRLTMASDLFTSIMIAKADPAYAYYVSEAGHGLKRIARQAAPEKHTDLVLLGDRDKLEVTEN